MIKEILEYDKKPDVSATVSSNVWKLKLSTMNRTYLDYDSLEKHRSLLDRFFNTEILVEWVGPSGHSIIDIVHSISSALPDFKLRYIKSGNMNTNGHKKRFMARIAIPRRHYAKVYKKIIQLKLGE